MSRPILVVDDDPSIREFVETALKYEGYEVMTAPNGAVALEVSARTAPSLILLDMRMPVMDGWQFAQKYRASPVPDAPIVVITAARDAAESAAQIHADAYLAKPFDLDDLLKLVERHARLP